MLLSEWMIGFVAYQARVLLTLLVRVLLQVRKASSKAKRRAVAAENGASVPTAQTHTQTERAPKRVAEPSWDERREAKKRERPQARTEYRVTLSAR